MALINKLSAIGDAIRAKTGKTDLIPLDQMPSEIASIQGGGGDAIIKTVSGTCPITLEDCVEESLLDYKIYGAAGGVGNQTANLFDKHYNVAYAGNAPNVVETAGGLSTEWLEVSKIGTAFTFALNVTKADTSIVVGYVSSDDKTTINLRNGFINAGNFNVNEDNFRNFYLHTTAANSRYVKFYVTASNLVNDMRVYQGVNNNLTEPYGFVFPIKINDTVHEMLLSYNLDEGDYLDFENRVMVRNGVPYYVDLPVIQLQEGSNTFDVDTTVKPSSVSLTYVKSVEFNTMKTVEGTLPLSVEGVGQRLEDYKIWGLSRTLLPEGYTPVEYLESTGTQYILIPYRVNNKTVFYCRYNETKNGPNIANAIFGVTDETSTSIAKNGILRLTRSSYNRMGWGDNTEGSIKNVTAPIEFGTWYEVLYDQNKLYQDGALCATSNTSPTTVWAANYDLGLFARNSASVTMFSCVKISRVWAKEDDEYVFDLVPAVRDADNIPGMYDLISGSFFTNSGSGSFVNGAVQQNETGQVGDEDGSGGYTVPVIANGVSYSIRISEKLSDDDYIDFENRKVVIGGVTTMMELPEIYLQNGANIIDVDTTVKPSKISVSFVRPADSEVEVVKALGLEVIDGLLCVTYKEDI